MTPSCSGIKNCFCKKHDENLLIHQDGAEEVSPFNLKVSMESGAEYSRELTAMCKRGNVADGTYQRVYTNKFKFEQTLCDPSLSSAASYVTDIRAYDSSSNPNGYLTEQKYDDPQNCRYQISHVADVVETTSCPFLQRSVFLSQGDLSTLVTQFPDSSKADADNHGITLEGNNYIWDGIQDTYSTDRVWAYYQFYIRYTNPFGATYWLGGDSTPAQFTLNCDPCVNK